jgi:hypothetical protein
MKRVQLTVQTFIIDDLYDLGDIRIYWSDQDSRWWDWKYSPDGEISGSWFWAPWFWPPVTMYNPSDVDPHPSNDQWCMVLIKTSYGSADDAILNPTNVSRQPYAVLYAGWELKGGTTEPETPWFDQIVSIPPEPRNWLEYGRETGSGIGLFAAKNVMRVNPATNEKEEWILPPSGPRRIWWDTADWKEPDDPYDKDEMDFEMLKRRGQYKKDPPEHIPAGWTPKKYNFGGTPKPSPTPQPKPKTTIPPPVVVRRKT